MTIWEGLHRHRQATRGTTIRHLFDADPGRFDRFSLWVGDMLLDTSKTHIDETAGKLLLDLARGAKLEAARDAMFSGEKINTTEGRAVLHTALRNRSNDPVFVDGSDVMPHVREMLRRTGSFAEGVRRGDIAAAEIAKPARGIRNVRRRLTDVGR